MKELFPEPITTEEDKETCAEITERENHELVACENTDKVIYRRPTADGHDWKGYDQPSLLINKYGALGINVGGTVIFRTIEGWHQLAVEHRFRRGGE